VQDSQTTLEFANGSRYVSHPCRPPRGKAMARIYLDEMAHYQEGLDREIYTAALPSTTRGDGYIRIGSSPLGASGLFWEIATESLKRYPGYASHRHKIPWWSVHALCNGVRLATNEAPGMNTEDRVHAFGTRALVEIFENMFLEDFQQEYECAWVDEATAWIPWPVIKRNQEIFDGRWWHAKSVDEALQMVPEIWRAVGQRQIESVFVGGVDIGRTHDLTEFVVLGRSSGGRLPVRFCVSLSNVEFDDQQRCLWHIITQLPFTVVLVDRNGLGMQLAENLSRTGRAAGVDFTNQTKELFAVEARVQMERGNIPIPSDRDLAYQIHSIKKTITAAKNARFDAERNKKHHADRFWALALAAYAASAYDTAIQMQDEVIALPWATIG
jgi:phage FluMu gp28-like protein